MDGLYASYACHYDTYDLGPIVIDCNLCTNTNTKVRILVLSHCIWMCYVFLFGDINKESGSKRDIRSVIHHSYYHSRSVLLLAVEDISEAEKNST